jgi:hypothetical protein
MRREARKIEVTKLQSFKVSKWCVEGTAAC